MSEDGRMGRERGVTEAFVACLAVLGQAGLRVERSPAAEEA